MWPDNQFLSNIKDYTFVYSVTLVQFKGRQKSNPPSESLSFAVCVNYNCTVALIISQSGSICVIYGWLLCYLCFCGQSQFSIARVLSVQRNLSFVRLYT